ncbi:MAG: hypothetical protein ACK5LM_04570 [Lactovum sp.]
MINNDVEEFTNDKDTTYIQDLDKLNVNRRIYASARISYENDGIYASDTITLNPSNTLIDCNYDGAGEISILPSYVSTA